MISVTQSWIWLAVLYFIGGCTKLHAHKHPITEETKVGFISATFGLGLGTGISLFRIYLLICLFYGYLY